MKRGREAKSEKKTKQKNPVLVLQNSEAVTYIYFIIFIL